MNQLLQQLTESFVAATAPLIALGVGWFSMVYLSRRRKKLHRQRMAALVKGLRYAGVANDIFSKPTPKSRDHTLRGLRWLFGAAGLSLALYAYVSLQPADDPTSAARAALAGVVPGTIGLAHLLFSTVSRNRQRLNFRTRTLNRSSIGHRGCGCRRI